MSLYQDLGVDEDATSDDISRAHRSAAKRTHPDAGGDRDAFERVQRAYVVLRDPAKRERYDRTGTIDDAPNNEAGQRAQLVVSAFERAIKGGNLERRDIVAAMRSHLAQDRAGLHTQILEAKAELALTTKAGKRLRFNGDGADVLGGMLNQRAAAIEATIEALESSKALVDAAIVAAGEYAWECDAAPVMPTFFTNATMSNSAWT